MESLLGEVDIWSIKRRRFSIHRVIAEKFGVQSGQTIEPGRLAMLLVDEDKEVKRILLERRRKRKK